MDESFVETVNQQSGISEPQLNYRDSIIFCLGITRRKYTKSQLYKVYTSMYETLEKNRLISFYMPSEKLFKNMLRKLMKEGIVEEKYDQQRYVLELTVLGTGVFDVIQDTLKRQDVSRKLYKIYRLYREYPIYS